MVTLTCAVEAGVRRSACSAGAITTRSSVRLWCLGCAPTRAVTGSSVHTITRSGPARSTLGGVVRLASAVLACVWITACGVLAIATRGSIGLIHTGSAYSATVTQAAGGALAGGRRACRPLWHVIRYALAIEAAIGEVTYAVGRVTAGGSVGFWSFL